MFLKNIIIEDGLFSGYSFREKIEHNPEGNVGIIQMKDISNNYTGLEYSNIDKVSYFNFKDKLFLQKGDIVFVSKGVNNYALIIENINQQIIASATFFVIRVNTNKVLPEYLTWYINQKEAQNYFSEKKAGTYVPNLNKQDILDLPIVIPKIALQLKIANTVKLLNRELLIYENLKTKRKELIQTQLLNLIKND